MLNPLKVLGALYVRLFPEDISPVITVDSGFGPMQMTEKAYQFHQKATEKYMREWGEYWDGVREGFERGRQEILAGKMPISMRIDKYLRRVAQGN